MSKTSKRVIIFFLLFVSLLFSCSTTNPNYNTWNYNEYINTDYQSTPEWQETDSILDQLNTPQKVADYLCKNYWFYDYEFRKRNGLNVDKMISLAEAVPPPSRLIKTHGATCITTANFSRIALAKAGHEAEVMRIHLGDIKKANRSILTMNASIHFICIVHSNEGWQIVGDTFSGQNRQWCKIQGPWSSIQELADEYPHYKGAQWKIVTSQLPTYGHVPEKEKCRGVSCD